MRSETPRSRFSSLRAAMVLLTFAAGPPGLAHAHELGAMSVKARFSADDTYTIDIVVDADLLPAGQSPFPGLADEAAGAGAVGTADGVEKLSAFRERFLDAVRISFDGTPVEPHAGASGPQTDSSSGPSRRIEFHLVGRVPAGARSFTWSHAMPLGSYLLRVQNEGDADPANQWLEGGRASRSFPLRHVTPPPSLLQTARLYLALGFTHIVPLGLDHILFVLGIFLLSRERRPILTQVTAFTIAHSITLGLSIYGVVSLSPRIVEPMIALSIVYVAVENIFVGEFRVWRVAIVFTFGLLHGMGFAGVLREMGLPRSQFIPALVSFNVGVEAGQLTVIACAFLAVGLWFGARPWYRARICAPASAMIAAVGLYWTIQRVLF